MASGIYQIRNTANGKLYIGSAVDIKARWRTHRMQLRQERHHSIALQRAWDKYGASGFHFIVLILCAPKNLLFYEQRLIDAWEPEYNCRKLAGSMLGYKHSDATRAKISAIQKGKTLSAETRAKVSAALTGKKRIARSAQHRMNLSAARLGRRMKPCAPETRAKISAAQKGRPLSKEHCAALSRAHIGRPWSAIRRAAFEARQ